MIAAKEGLKDVIGSEPAPYGPLPPIKPAARPLRELFNVVSVSCSFFARTEFSNASLLFCAVRRLPVVFFR